MDNESELLKVLIIEHDNAFARILEGMLQQADEMVASVSVAPSLDQALELLAVAKPDVVILEFFLPDGAGLMNIPLLREHAPHVPIIVIGAADDEAFALEAVHADAQDYLVKSHLSRRSLLRSIRYTMERHQAEMALVAAEETYRGFFNHLVEGIFQTTSDGRYKMANPALARIYGYGSADELVNNMTDIARRLYVQPGRREEFKRIMEERDTITNFESQIFRKDGSMIWISENCRAVRDAEGRLLYYEGTVEDITQRQQAELGLRDSEALYHSLVETLPQNIFRKDLQEKFTFANQQMCRTLGRKLEDVIGKTDFDFFPSAMATKYQLDDARVMATGVSYETVEEHQPPGGSKMYVQVVKTPLRAANGQITGLQGIFWDITAAKVAEEQIRQANVELASSREELRKKNLQMQDDLKMAREIQFTLLPQQYPVLPRGADAANSAFRFTHRYLPTGSVGGDFFTVTDLSDTEVAVFICDVAGHGVRSALITALIRATVQELETVAGNPGQFMTRLNSDFFSMLKHSGSPVVTTAFYLVADCATGRLSYANAGHPMPLHLRRSAVQVAPLPRPTAKRQPALGLFPQATFECCESMLSPGDVIMLFTDGLIDIRGKNGQDYTQQHLSASVQQRVARAIPQLFDEVLAEIREISENNEFDDDVCVVGMEFVGPTDGKNR